MKVAGLRDGFRAQRLPKANAPTVAGSGWWSRPGDGCRSLLLSRLLDLAERTFAGLSRTSGSRRYSGTISAFIRAAVLSLRRFGSLYTLSITASPRVKVTMTSAV